MPCYYTGSAEGDRRLAEQEQYERENQHTTTLITGLTRMLCLTCQELETNNIHIPRGVRGWWAAHKKIDAKRKDKS